MLRITTAENCKDLTQTLEGIRATFSTVFARHYTNLLIRVRKRK